jgi:hypothetical protein
MLRPDELDDKYYPLSCRENAEWLINDLYIYCEHLEETIKKLKRKTKKSKGISNVILRAARQIR